MSAIGVLAIVVAVGEAKTATTDGLLAAAEEALIAGTSVRISEVLQPSDDAALSLENELDARASVALVWDDNLHERAHIRLHVARTDRWTDRQIRFAPADTPRERGRTVGFAIASMWPDGAAPVRSRKPPSVARTAPGSPSAATGASSAPPGRTASRSPTASSPAARAPSEPARPPAPTAEELARDKARVEAAERLARLEVEREAFREKTGREMESKTESDLRATSNEESARRKWGPPLPNRAVGFAGLFFAPMGDLLHEQGGSVDGALFVRQDLAACVEVSVATGTVQEFGKHVVASMSAGAEWWPRPPSLTGRVALAIRAGAVLIYHHVYMNGGDDDWTVLPGVVIGPRMSVRLSGDVELMLGIDTQSALGKTHIDIRGQSQSRALPTVRIVGQGGFRFRF